MATTATFPHNTNSTACVNRYEPIVSSNFNAHFVLMGSLKDKLGDYGFLSEYIKSLSGMMVEKAANTIEGGYKTTKFKYDSNDKETTYEIEAAFFNFLDNENRALVLNALLAWSREKYNPLTGEKTLKNHYANACIVAEKFQRDGTIFWRRVAHNVFPSGDIADQGLDYSSHDMQELACTFSADWVTDVTNDARLAGADTF